MNGASSPNRGAHNMPGLRTNGQQNQKQAANSSCCSRFQMPLHYPRYKKSDYETMPEWKLDCLLNEYGLPIMGDVTQKRRFSLRCQV
ncbi:hypothetical protein Patl1_17574 [Pistacia atlantica]|uniref:Uncharacterized protein n=1 Tax=Pistacia atlantica TaxID=434234 RepID=A0ACC1C1F4_9ROSI|nr:hypothetical protein Patl1_17574 [Pistacia atlantica]